MAMLEVEGLTKAFGGVVANNDISFSVEEGEILGLIGPNGAGKSTVFELLTGFHSADAGRVRFQGRPILGLRPDQINRLGMGRTFQKLKPFQRMTVEENVMVGGLQHDADLGAAREQALTALERRLVRSRTSDIATRDFRPFVQSRTQPAAPTPFGAGDARSQASPRTGNSAHAARRARAGCAAQAGPDGRAPRPACCQCQGVPADERTTDGSGYRQQPRANPDAAAVPAAICAD